MGYLSVDLKGEGSNCFSITQLVRQKKAIINSAKKKYINKSSGMRTFRTLFDLASDWLMVKWSVLIGREQVSRD